MSTIRGEVQWPEILLWLPEEPEATAQSLFERLHRHYPGRFTAGQLRTLRRRIREWRRALARELVYTCLGGQETAAQPVVIGADGTDPREPAAGEAFPAHAGNGPGDLVQGES